MQFFKTLGAVHTLPRHWLRAKALIPWMSYVLKGGDVETLCKNVKCPGGAAGGDNRSANLGHLVSEKAEMNIKLAAYYLQYSEKIS